MYVASNLLTFRKKVYYILYAYTVYSLIGLSIKRQTFITIVN